MEDSNEEQLMENSSKELDVVEEHKEERDEVILCPHHIISNSDRSLHISCSSPKRLTVRKHQNVESQCEGADLTTVDEQELEDGANDLGRKEHVLPYHGDAGVF